VTAPARTLMVCADDFGPSPATAAVIVALACAGRLNATSCITNAAAWRQQAPRLADAPATLQTGLHLNLSEGVPLSAALARVWPRLPGLPALLVQAHAGRLPLAALADEWAAQLDAFQQGTGRPPAYVDGHQHVHHLPGVREVLLRSLATLPPGTAVRSTGAVAGPGFGFKRWVIARTGGSALAAELRRRGTPHNATLLGVYDFAAPDYRVLMQAWLKTVAAASGGAALLFCHPGAPDRAAAATATATADPIGAARVREAAYLGSAAFTDDLAAAGVALASAWPVPVPVPVPVPGR